MTIIEHPTPAQLREAYRQMRAALRDGRLVRPDTCTWCGKAQGERTLHGHHPDYARPLMVVWLCPACHSKHHHYADMTDAGYATMWALMVPESR